MQKSWRRFQVFIIMTLILFSYQNCAPSLTGTDSSTDQVEHDFTSQKKILGGICQIENLRCSRKIYAPDIADQSSQESLCVNEPSICLEVITHSYNSRLAIDTCPECSNEAALPGGEYNRQEFTCWLGDSRDSMDQVFAIRPTLQEAINAAYDACDGE